MQAPENGWHRNEFRDPQVWEENGTWHMVLGAMEWNGSANMPVVAEYTSANLTDWEGPTVLVQGTNAANFYECPDVFKTANGTYLVYSEINNSDRKVHYLYKPNGASAWTVPAVDVLDGQGFYAGKTAYDGYDRYIFGWCDRRAGSINENGLAWGGTLVTHKLYEKAAGTLALTVPHKFLTNFGTVGTLKTRETSGMVTMSGGTYTMAENSSVSFGRLKVKNAIETTVTASSNTDEVFAFSFVDNSDRDAVYTIRLNLAHQKIYFNKDGSNSVQEINKVPLLPSADGVYNIRIYNDQSVCVMYVNDQVAFTNRIYGMPKNPWRMACEHGSVTVSGLTVKN
jgi:beta-fructofuranosidase